MMAAARRKASSVEMPAVRAHAASAFPKPAPVPSVSAPDTDLEAALEELRAGARALAAALESARSELERTRRDALATTETELVKLAVAIAERAVGRELRADPTLVVAWAREGIEALGEADRVKCVVSEDVAVRLEDAGGWAPDGVHVEVEVDATLPPESCQIRGKFGRVDAGLRARLDAIAHAVLGAEGAS